MLKRDAGHAAGGQRLGQGGAEVRRVAAVLERQELRRDRLVHLLPLMLVIQRASNFDSDRSSSAAGDGRVEGERPDRVGAARRTRRR